ncbi:MAG: LuxR C-terminal-related transcriptional regulator [Candidatus Nanopelagicales bacterium]
MINVAQNPTELLVPVQRGRFSAMTVGAENLQTAGLAPRLRSLGASVVHRAPTALAGPLPQPAGPHDVCIVTSGGPELRAQVRELRTAGWRRVVVVTSRTDLIRQAVGSGARAAIVPPARFSGVGILTPPRHTAHEGADSLSARELQVLQSVADGHTNRQIGEALCLSALTVKSHLARIGRKLGTGDRAEMVAIGMRCSIVS